MIQNITLTLSTDVVYLTGTVNGISVTWTYKGSGVWATTAERTKDDTYVLNLVATKANGMSYNITDTLYMGLQLITDRTQGDVEQVQYLNSLSVEDMTAAELDEYINGICKGAYNATDINRVGAAVNYLAALLFECGYSTGANLPDNVNIDDIYYNSPGNMSEVDLLQNYLYNVNLIREGLSTLPTTPETPTKITNYIEANDIEQILLDVEFLLNNMIAAYRYSNTFYAGEDDY